MSFFLPREQGSIETGPQIFTRTGIQNTRFLFTREPSSSSSSGPILLNSILVSNAGEINVRGTYNFVTTLNEKPYYTKGSEGIFFVIYLDNQWNIFNFNLSSNPIYSSTQNVLYPWLVTTWNSSSPSYLPLPVVTQIL
jgi:hypothetical protein